MYSQIQVPLNVEQCVVCKSTKRQSENATLQIGCCQDDLDENESSFLAYVSRHKKQKPAKMSACPNLVHGRVCLILHSCRRETAILLKSDHKSNLSSELHTLR